MQWFYAKGNDRKGPLEEERLKEMIASGLVMPEDLVWNESMGDEWLPVSDVPVLAAASTQMSAGPFTGTGGEMPNRDITLSARGSLSGQWGIAVGAMLVYMLVIIAASAIPVINIFAPILVGGPLMLGISMLYLSLSRGRQPSMGQLFDGFSRFGAAFGAYLLITVFILLWALPVMIGAPILLVYGLKQSGASTAADFPVWIGAAIAILIIPVIIAAFRYAMTFFVLADNEDCGPLDAIRESTRMMKGNKWKYFMLNLRFVGWAILATFTFGIGFLFLSPYVFTSQARFYDDVATVGAVVE